ATASYIARGRELFGGSFTTIPVLFDLTGRAAGMYRVTGGHPVIRYNPYIFAKAFTDHLMTTVPHEVAHYVVDMVHGARHVRPHGAEWRAVMTALGAEPRRTGAYDLTGVPVRRERRHPYHCGCTTHHLTSRRHNRVRRGAMRYYCRRCAQPLVPVDQSSR
ncbi:MAG: SprT-like domain-containing protein, partial [Nitrospirota bacterium]